MCCDSCWEKARIVILPGEWTVNRRANGLIEWVCPHGVGHPAPKEHQGHDLRDCDYIHGCDGCCSYLRGDDDDNGV